MADGIIDLRKQTEITGDISVDTTGLATEAKQDDQITILTDIELNTDDVSTETTLSALLTAFNAEDFATETTLDAIKSQTDQLTFIGDDLKVTLDGETVNIDTNGLATEAKQDDIIAELEGEKKDIEVDEVTAAGAQLTDDDVQSMSILFIGRLGTLDGVTVPNGYFAEFSPNGPNDTVSSIGFTVPTAGAGQRVIVTYVKNP